MSMHMEGPWLSTTGRRKGKQKFASAEHKHKADMLEREWEDLKKKWGIEEEGRRRNRALKAKVYVPPARTYRGADAPRAPSLDSGHTGAVSLKPTPQYTGDKIVGIGTMHKSNAVPIFSDQEAKDISSMRR